MNKKTQAPIVPPTQSVSQAKTWKMVFHKDFILEFQGLDPDVKKDLLAAAKAVGKIGPTAGRPHVDALNNPPHPNMKEMRFNSKNGSEVWRVAFAFDKNSDGIILCAGDKQGVKSDEFYKKLLKKANARFSDHIKTTSSKSPPASPKKPVSPSKKKK